MAPIFRTRSTGSFQAFDMHGTDTAFNGTVTADNSVYLEGYQVGETQTMTDVITHDFQKRIRAGEIVMNPMRSVKTVRSYKSTPTRVRKLTGSGGTVQYYRRDGFAGPVIDAYLATPEPVVSPVTEAGTKAWAGVLKPYAELQVERAELRKTLETFRIKTGYLNRHLESLLRFASRKGKLAKGVSFFANNWLKYRYGIMPLVKSIDSVLENFGRIRARRETSRGKAEAQADSYQSVDISNAFFRVSFAMNKRRTILVRSMIIYEVNEGWDEYGTNLSNLGSTAWELIPYSFVLDWAVNVGSYIRAITPHFGVRYLDGCTVVEDEVTSDVRAVGSAYIGGTLYTPELSPTLSDGYTRKVTTKTRSIGLPVRGLTIRPSSLKAIPTDKRIIDVFALASQLLRR